MLKNIQRKLKKPMSGDFYSLLKHGKNYISANVFLKGLSVITLPIFTRLLTPNDYGIIAILASFISIFGIIYGFGLNGAIVRYYHEKTDDYDKFIGTAIILLFFWSLILSLILFIFKEQVLIFFNIPARILYIGIIIVFFEVYFKAYQYYLQASKQSKLFAKINVYKGVISAVLSIVLILQIQNSPYYGKAYALLITTLIACVYSILKLRSLLSLSLSKTHTRYALLFSLPIVFHQLSRYILNSFDKVIINQIVGPSETGLYAIAYQVGSLQQMISYGLLMAWTPIFYEKLNKGYFHDLSNLGSKYARIVYLNAFFLVLFAREIVIILADKKYHEALDIIPIVIISFAFIFLYSIYAGFAFYHKKTHLIAIFTIIAGAVNIGLNYYLIPIYGYKIAAWTTLVSFALLFILHYINTRFILKSEGIIKLRYLLPNFLMLLGFIFIYYIISFYINDILLIVTKVLMLTLLAYLYFKKEIYNIVF